VCVYGKRMNVNMSDKKKILSRRNLSILKLCGE